jgi:hypothetical protein
MQVIGLVLPTISQVHKMHMHNAIFFFHKHQVRQRTDIWSFTAQELITVKKYTHNKIIANPVELLASVFVLSEHCWFAWFRTNHMFFVILSACDVRTSVWLLLVGPSARRGPSPWGTGWSTIWSRQSQGWGCLAHQRNLSYDWCTPHKILISAPESPGVPSLLPLERGVKGFGGWGLRVQRRLVRQIIESLLGFKERDCFIFIFNIGIVIGTVTVTASPSAPRSLEGLLPA